MARTTLHTTASFLARQGISRAIRYEPPVADQNPRTSKRTATSRTRDFGYFLNEYRKQKKNLPRKFRNDDCCVGWSKTDYYSQRRTQGIHEQQKEQAQVERMISYIFSTNTERRRRTSQKNSEMTVGLSGLRKPAKQTTDSQYQSGLKQKHLYIVNIIILQKPHFTPMKRIITLTAFLLLLCSILIAGPSTTSEHIKIDQFGYLPDAQKICVISDPVNGFNSGQSFTPGSTYEIRNWSDDLLVFSANISAWNGGNVHTQSGDRVWWFDFSAFNTPGEYYVFDPSNQVGSFQFQIANDVYKEVLKTAVRTFYYQRSNLEKVAPYAEPGWIDSNPSHVGPQQDLDCRAVLNPAASTSKDLSGGWFDAGDYNKYVNFADGVLHDLLAAYEQNPGIWGDDYDIPESGNGVPDLLDEIKWELDWFLKMQLSDGSVLHKISVTDFGSASPPSADTGFRRYAPATTSATISACGAFAHAASVFKTLSDPNMQAYATTLENAAIDAWNWLNNNPGWSNYDNAGFVNANSEDYFWGGADWWYNQLANKVCAAAYLFGMNGDNTYKTYFDNNYTDLHLNVWGYVYAFESEYQNAALYYTSLTNANPTVSSDILSDYENSMIVNHSENFPSYTNNEDAYRAYLTDNNTGWGSNSIKSSKGSMMYNLVSYGIDSANETDHINAASGYIHYLHGVNPLNLVYLTNMSSLGAESSANTMYHSWFNDGSALWDEVGISTYGPAPGYVTGGCNPGFAPDPSFGGTISPPQNQPVLKSYLDWNTSYPQNSWEITEPAIYYQAAYIKLLSKFVSNSGSTVNLKVFLQGPYNNNGEMNNFGNEFIPLDHPYDQAPYNYTGSENLSGIPSDMVDWILVEARTGSPNLTGNRGTNTIETKAAVLLKNGNVLGTDGNALRFENLQSGQEYYFCIRHRNHLDVLSSTAIIANNSMSYDFTTDVDQAWGVNQMANGSDGKASMYAGDFNKDGSIQTTDFDAWKLNPAILNIYLPADANLDGTVQTTDYDKWFPNRAKLGNVEIDF